eukprot:3177429-Rhodomonas_salina.1
MTLLSEWLGTLCDEMERGSSNSNTCTQSIGLRRINSLRQWADGLLHTITSHTYGLNRIISNLESRLTLPVCIENNESPYSSSSRPSSASGIMPPR